MNNEVIGQLIANSIITTAILANEVSIQTKGEYLLPEEDYLHYVRDFQLVLSKKIVPVSTKDGLKQEAASYVESLILKLKGTDHGESDISGIQDGKNLEILPDGIK